MDGRIFSIEEFSTFDGPGIRMTVFLKSCPLKCAWCHNPEGQKYEIEYYRNPNGCLNCNNCLTDGKFSENSINACKRNLIRKFGEDVSAKALCDKILKNQKILNMNNGGVTFSGGEPLNQSEFLIECLENLKDKVHTCVQTCGYSENFEKVLNKTDMFLYDLKLIDKNEHLKYCGTDNEIIIKNYKLLAKSKTPFITRVPLITGITDTKENITSIAELLKSVNVSYVEVLSYNNLAGAKYKGLLREYTLNIDNAKSTDAEKIFNEYGIEVKKV